MGDSENALPPSKKRAAGRELTRDTPLDDDEDTPELEAGTFKRASDEVLATRRIVKVRRHQTDSAPSSNPFAAIRLVATSESSANPGDATTETKSAGEKTAADDSKDSGGVTTDSEKAKDEESKQSENKTHEVEDKSEEHAEESNADKSEVDNEQSKDGNKSENKDKKDAVDKVGASDVDKEQFKDDNDTQNDDKKGNSDNKDKKDNKVESEEPSAEGGTLTSFQQLSSTQNAFTGLSGSGFSTSLFSFGSISNDGSALGIGSGSVFGMKNDKPLGLGLSNNGSSGFGTSAVSKSEGSGFSTLQEAVVETGEENEEVVFNADSVILFEFVDGSWKERGKGELKVNVTNGTEQARLVMRSRGNYRLILNARLYSDMRLTNIYKKGVTFACINSAAEGKHGLSTFALKFKDVSIVEEFKAAVMAHKGETSTVLKTSENSSKTSDV